MDRSARTCPQCLVSFVPTSRRGRIPTYCSQRCQERAKSLARVERDRNARAAARAELRCASCGESLATRRATRYCSKRCADRDSDRFHRRRLVERGARTGEVVSFAEIAKRDLWTCYLCRQPIDPAVPGPSAHAASLDHVIPLSKGGAHAPSNLRLAHLGCNRRKGTRMLQEVQT